LRVRGDAARIVVGCAGDEAGAETVEEALAALEHEMAMKMTLAGGAAV
jgi:hypothetical protein